MPDLLWNSAWSSSRTISKTKTPRWSLWVCEDLLDQATRRRARQTLADFGLRAISHPPGMIATELTPTAASLPPVEVRPVER